MALFNSFTFGDVNSEHYGVYISGDSVYNSPARSVDLVQVPGRNGALALDNGYYENIEVTYPAGSFGTSQEEWREKMLGIRNALAAQRGYQKLIDTYHPEHYRLGMFFAGISASPVQYNRAGQFPIRFNCKPQRFLISGDEAVEFTAEGQEEVYGPSSIASFEIEEGEEIREAVVNLEPIQNLNGYDNPWPAGGGKNISSTSEAVTNSNGNVNASSSGTFGDCKANVQYTISFSVLANSATTINLRYNNGSNIKSWTAAKVVTGARLSYTYTPTDDGSFNFYSSGNSFAASTKVFDKIQVEAGAEPTAYAPYSNICPISGHTEVMVVRSGENMLTTDKTKWGLYGTSESGYASNAQRFAPYSQTIPFEAGKSYTIDVYNGMGVNKTFYVGVSEYNPSTTRIVDHGWQAVPYTFTVNANTTVIRMGFRDNSYSNCADYIAAIGTKLFVTMTEEAADTYPISFGQTVYGGTLNVTTGVLTVDRALVDLGDLGWSKSTNYFASTSINTVVKRPTTHAELIGLLSDIYPEISSADAYNGVATGVAIRDTNGNVWIRDTSYTDAASFKTAMSGHVLVYPLKTSTTIQLTPTQVSTLLGANNIYADSGEVEVKVASPVDLTNPTNFPAKPLIRIYGNGSARVGDTIATVQNNADGYVDIDCESMNCYDTTGGRNADVSFSGNDFPELASGDNGILLTGPSKVEITPRWWEL